MIKVMNMFIFYTLTITSRILSRLSSNNKAVIINNLQDVTIAFMPTKYSQ